MDENTFWLHVWRFICVAIVFAIITMGGCQVNKQYVLRDMIKNGADPMKAACAVYIHEASNDVLCVVNQIQRQP